MDTIDELIRRARRWLERECGTCVFPDDIGPLLVRTLACALCPDRDPLADEPPPHRPSEWPRLTDEAARWLEDNAALLVQCLTRQMGSEATARAQALLLRQRARLARLAADLLTSQPLAPPVRLCDKMTVSDSRHVILFGRWAHVTHELWPLLVDALQAVATGTLASEVVAAHASWTDDECRLRRALRYDPRADRLIEGDLARPCAPRSVHLLCAPPEDERRWYMHWATRCAAQGIALANPAQAAALADDKWETYARWRTAGVPTPATWLIPRHMPEDERRAVCTEAARGAVRLVVKPRYGTEGRGVRVVPADPHAVWDAVGKVHVEADDAIVQEYRGSLRWRDDEGTFFPATLRLHVAFDGRGEPVAESGYVHVARDPGAPIATIGTDGRAQPVVRERLALVAHGGELRPLSEDDTSRIAALAERAVRALWGGDPPEMRPRLAGVDLLIETDEEGCAVPLALEVNVRPAGLAHSRFLTPGWREIGPPGVSLAMWESRE